MATKAKPAGIQDFRFGPWTGMNEKASPERLPPGVAADIQNFLLDEAPGVAVKRQGTRLVATLPSGNPARDGYVFKLSNGQSYFLMSDGATLYYTTDPTLSSAYHSIKTGLTSSAFMSFETAEDKVWMSNGIDSLMTWDATTLIVFDRTYTSVTDASAVSSSTITHSGLGAVDSYWVGMKLVFTVGNNVGTTVSVTSYNGTTKVLTFTPAVASAAATTDRWIVGLSLPKFNALRYWDSHMFAADDPDNPAEVRFSALSDPDTGALITLDNPRAWPSANQIAINTADGDQVGGFSPILRDRILVHKASGIWRIERDPLVTYRPELVSKAVGSKFPDSWVEKNYMLYFVGQDQDGLPEMYKTDMVSVDRVDPDGGVEPTIRGFRQPNQIQESANFTSQADFDEGAKSTMLKTSGDALEIGGYDDAEDWQGAGFVSGSNIDIETTPGSVALIGCPVWEARYEGDVLPANCPSGKSTTPRWTRGSGSGSHVASESVSTGKLVDKSGISPPDFGGYNYHIDGLLSSAQDVIFSIRASATNNSLFCLISNGAFGFAMNSNGLDTVDSSLHFTGHTSDSSVHTYTLLLKANGTYKIWIDGILIYTGTGKATTLNRIMFGLGDANPFPSVFAGGAGEILTVQAVYYHTNYKGDSLQSFGGIVSPIAMPNTLPTSAEIVVLNDLTRTPDALRRLYNSLETPGYLALCGTTSASLTVQLDTATDMSLFSVGEFVDLRTISTGVLITHGQGQKISTIDTGNHRITFTSSVGSVTTDSTVGVYKFNSYGIPASMMSWTSSVEDFLSGTDPAGYVSVAQGAVPTSLTYQYQRIKISLTGAGDYVNGPNLETLYSGVMWTSPPIDIGQTIVDWRTFLDSLTAPSGVDQTIKIRAATVTATPVESDWGSWTAITSGQNIGTILSDGSPPSTRWLQIKVEQGPSSAGLLPIVDSVFVQWDLGSSANLPLRAILHKKRYLFCAASGGASSNDSVVVNDRNDQWVKFSGWNLNAFFHYKGKFYGFDSANSNIYELDVDGLYTDNGVAIDAYLITRAEDMGMPALRKDLKYSYLIMDRGVIATQIMTSFRRSGDADFSSTSALAVGANADNVMQKFPVGTSARRIQRKYEHAVASQSIAFGGEIMFFSSRPAQPI